MRPNRLHLTALMDSLRLALADLDELQANLTLALEGELRNGSTKPDALMDGYSVESAACMRAEGKWPRDPARDRTLSAIRDVERAVQALQRARANARKALGRPQPDESEAAVEA